MEVTGYHMEGPRVPLAVRVPQVGNPCIRLFIQAKLP